MNYQLQNIKQQLKSLDPQFDNIINQTKRKTSSNIGSQFYDMSVQILNIGVRMFNIGIQNPEMEIDVPNLTFQVQSIIMQLQNFLNHVNNINNNMINPDNNIMMPPNPMMMPINAYNEDFIRGFNMGVEDFNKIEILFHTIHGVKTIIKYDKEATIDEVLKAYLKKVNKPELIRQPNKIEFVYKAVKIKLGDKTKICNFFICETNPKIIVLDYNKLIRG